MYWYRHVPNKWLAGTRGMTFEQKGVYIDLINLYVDRDGNLPDNEFLICRVLACRPQVWRRLKSELQKIEKLHVVEGKLVPNGCETTLKEAENYQKTQITKAKKRWKSTPEENSGIAYTSNISHKNLTSFSSETKPAREEVAKTEKQEVKNGKNGFHQEGHDEQTRTRITAPSRPEPKGSTPIAQPSVNRKRLAARAAWEVELGRCLGAEHYATAIDLLATNQKICDRATDAELRKAGSGAIAAMKALGEIVPLGEPP